MRESMEFDVVIVGAGPAGLSAACRLMQQAQASETQLTVCVIEKGSEVGAHIFSGAVFETTALDELFPDWKERNAPLNQPVSQDEIWLLRNSEKAIKVPNMFVPKTMHNDGNYIISLGNLCRWLAEQAEALGVEIFPGFAAAEILYNEDGSVKGVATGDMGVSSDGEEKSSFMPGMELHAKYTIFSEGSRGHLGKQLIEKFDLAKGKEVQHYGIGLKELWNVKPEKHRPGTVVHGAGWPLVDGANGGFFMYHLENNQVVVGMIADLSYPNPYMSPFDEFQRMKHHPVFKDTLEGGERISYGARALTKGGLHSLPKMTFPGGLLIGCDAGTLVFSKIKGSHTAMKSGMVAADVIFKAVNQQLANDELTDYSAAFKDSWAYQDLYTSRNFGAALHKFGHVIGGGFNYIDQNLFAGKLPLTISDSVADHQQLKPAEQCTQIHYPKPDGKISFDKLSSVFLSNTNHEEDQPCHLTLKDSDVPLSVNLQKFAGPEARFCPAGVYEFIENPEDKKIQLQINSQNCLHCKTCDIKDPTQNITWVVPEGGGGPNYPNM